MAETTPAPLQLVESFLNSVDTESGADDLAGVASFRRWLADHGRTSAATGPDGDPAADLALARELRDELRAETATHHDGEPRDRSRLTGLAGRVRLVSTFGPDGTVRLVPPEAGVPGFLGEILAAVALAAHDGSWRRLKICPAGDCRVVYYDQSRNASRRWCSMEVCGNRNKTRAYRQRGAAH
jgi:predicted RNA-binding Zn ribbon-like protein